eukprot:1195746-Prorocentrum_minimum.AAC.3
MKLFSFPMPASSGIKLGSRLLDTGAPRRGAQRCMSNATPRRFSVQVIGVLLRQIIRGDRNKPKP